VSNTTRKQALVLNKIEPCNLVEHEKGIYDHNVVRNGMLSALISKTNKMTLIPGATVRIDIPRVIPCD
jgi:hypothetical protein